MENHLPSYCFFVISIILIYVTNVPATNNTNAAEEKHNERSRGGEQGETTGAEIEKPGVVGNLILMTSHHETYDENKTHPLILPQDYIDEGDEPRAVFTRKDRFYYCGPKNRPNHCRSLCYAMGYPMHTCGRISCYCTF